jgi:DNA-binding MarR family transcriptional regulator
MPNDAALRRTFAILNEVGIIAQLSRAAFEARLPDGILLPHFTVVNHLARVRDGQTPLEMAQAFQVPKTTMSHMVSVVARHDWVELRPNPEDGRSKRVWLTEAGRRFRAGAIEALSPDLAEIEAAMDPGAQEVLLRHLTELRIFLDAHRDGRKGSSG